MTAPLPADGPIRPKVQPTAPTSPPPAAPPQARPAGATAPQPRPQVSPEQAKAIQRARAVNAFFVSISKAMLGMIENGAPAEVKDEFKEYGKAWSRVILNRWLIGASLELIENSPDEVVTMFEEAVADRKGFLKFEELLDEAGGVESLVKRLRRIEKAAKITVPEDEKLAWDEEAEGEKKGG